MRVNGDDVFGRDHVEHVQARPDLLEAEKVERGIRMKLARLPERGIGTTIVPISASV
jgi:hypothetical protein